VVIDSDGYWLVMTANQDNKIINTSSCWSLFTTKFLIHPYPFTIKMFRSTAQRISSPLEVQIVEDWAKTLWDELDYKKDEGMGRGLEITQQGLADIFSGSLMS